MRKFPFNPHLQMASRLLIQEVTFNCRPFKKGKEVLGSSRPVAPMLHAQWSFCIQLHSLATEPSASMYDELCQLQDVIRSPSYCQITYCFDCFFNFQIVNQIHLAEAKDNQIQFYIFVHFSDVAQYDFVKENKGNIKRFPMVRNRRKFWT